MTGSRSPQLYPGVRLVEARGSDSPEEVRALFRGMWFTLHLKGALARDADGMRSYEELVRDYAAHFPCAVCKEHLNAFIKDNPTQRYRNMRSKNGREIGMAQHSWMLHNNVNLRTGKPFMDWTTFEQLWLTDAATELAPCTKGCGN